MTTEGLLSRIREEVGRGTMPSAQVAIARGGDLLAFETFGDPEVAADPARYVTQSVGRTVIASAVWKLLGDGLLGLDERVVDVVPEFGTHGKDTVGIEHMLTHTGGFPFAPLGYPKMADREQRVAAFARWRLDDPPGTALQFHLTSVAWLIDEIVWRRTGTPLPEYLAREIAGPLGLGFELAMPKDRQSAVLAPMRCTDGPGAEVDPWGPWYLDNPDVVAAGEPAHAVVASAADIALHYQALLAALGGDASIWSPEVVADAIRPRVEATPAGEQIYGGSERRTAMGLFVVVRGSDAGSWMPVAASPSAFGHGGAAYQLAFADPASGISFAMLSNGYPASGYDYSPRGVEFIAEVGDRAASLAPEPGSLAATGEPPYRGR